MIYNYLFCFLNFLLSVFPARNSTTDSDREFPEWTWTESDRKCAGIPIGDEIRILIEARWPIGNLIQNPVGSYSFGSKISAPDRKSVFLLYILLFDRMLCFWIGVP